MTDSSFATRAQNLEQRLFIFVINLILVPFQNTSKNSRSITGIKNSKLHMMHGIVREHASLWSYAMYKTKI